jgi:hypothetical protein
LVRLGDKLQQPVVRDFPVAPAATEGEREQDVHVCGSNQYGQLGMGAISEAPVLSFTKTPKLPFQVRAASCVVNFRLSACFLSCCFRQIKDVSCGWRHTAVVTRCGNVFTCGDNSSGQLGVGTVGHVLPAFTQVTFPHHTGDVPLLILHVACGYTHTLAVTSDDLVCERCWTHSGGGALATVTTGCAAGAWVGINTSWCARTCCSRIARGVSLCACAPPNIPVAFHSGSDEVSRTRLHVSFANVSVVLIYQ